MPAPPLKSEISAPYPSPTNDTARTGFGKLWDYVTGLLGATGNQPEARAALGVGIRGHLDGLTLSTNGNNVITIAAGEAADSTNSQVMQKSAATGKDTTAWAVGDAGGLDTGVIAPNTWYHFYLIKRLDTGVTDVVFSLSATTPTMPANYTLKRRIGARKTDNSNIWISSVQDGDLVQLVTPVIDVSVNNPGAAPVTRALASIPTGVKVIARLRVTTNNSSSNVDNTLISDLDTIDSIGFSGVLGIGDIGPEASAANSTSTSGGRVDVRTNTNAQIRTKNTLGNASVTLTIVTLGWIDRRGRDA